jgi:hypothetical protein
MTLFIVVCWTPYVRAQFYQGTMAVWPRGQVYAFAMVTNDVIVAGWGIGFTLGQFFDHPQKRIWLPDKYVSKVANRLDAPMQRRVFYVTGRGVPSGRTATIRDFGQAEVTIYSGNTARALLQEWREDLLRRTAGRVYAPFAGDYQLLALLEERLPSGQSADQWRSLAERCRPQHPAAHDTPRHLEQTARAVIFP